MTANLILLSTVEQKIEEGFSNTPAEIVARENNACRRVIPFCFIDTSFIAEYLRLTSDDLLAQKRQKSQFDYNDFEQVQINLCFSPYLLRIGEQIHRSTGSVCVNPCPAFGGHCAGR
jgi:hypothetical protein